MNERAFRDAHFLTVTALASGSLALLVGCAAQQSASPVPSQPTAAPMATASASSAPQSASSAAPPLASVSPGADTAPASSAPSQPESQILEALGKGGQGLGGILGGGSKGGATRVADESDSRPRGPSPVLREGNVVVTGGLSEEVVRREVRRRMPRVRYCYQKGLMLNPTLAGQITTTFTISKEGKVTSISEKSVDIGDKGVVTCIEKTFQTIAFPTSSDAATQVVYPIAFAPGP